MKTTNKILTAVAVAVLVGAGAFALKTQAAATNDDLPIGHGFFRKKLAELGVTDAQKTQVRAILKEHLPAISPLVSQLVIERRALRDTIRADQVDEAAIRAQAAKVAVIEASLDVERAHIVHQIKPLLTPDQLVKFKEMQTKGDARFDEFLSRVAKNIAAD